MGAFQSQPLNGRGNEEETTLAVTKVLLLVGVEIVQVLVTHFTDSKRDVPCTCARLQALKRWLSELSLVCAVRFPANEKLP
ncbi:MAG: hypothetical protein JWO20_1334 [Candidatus Angelobacter sp.]|nr:hypothetical protein [Candidatus Angelobacter sp.]